MNKLLLIYLISLIPMSACAVKPKAILLRWNTTDVITDYSPKYISSYMNKTFAFGDVTDGRTIKDYIGVNLEHVNTPKYYAVKNSIKEFILNNQPLIFYQYRIRTDTVNYDYKIEARLLTFYVVEESTYKGKIDIEYSIYDRSGALVCSALANGKSNRWGMSFSEGMYLECISNSLFSCLMDLLSKCDLRKE
jgi:hypothetical protein